MESIKKLREICQKPRLYADTWYGRHFARLISIYITRIFLQANISANTVTLMFTVVGILASILFAFGTRISVIAGALLLQLWYILDHVDGEIARYTGKSSLTGIYFDRISHYIVHPLVFFCLGIGLCRNTDNLIFIITGIISGFSVFLLSLTDDLRELTLFSCCIDKGVKPKSTDQQASADKQKTSIPKKMFIFIHKLCTYPNVMNIINIFALLDLFLKQRHIGFVLYFYSIATTLVWITKLIFFIKNKKLESELN